MDLQQLKNKINSAHNTISESGFEPTDIMVEFDVRTLTDGSYAINDIEFSFDVFNPTIVKAIIS